MFTPAIRSNLHGRASGGILYGIKKSLYGSLINFKIIESKIIFHMVSNNLNYYIIPIYLNCNNWLSDFDELVEFMNKSSLDNVLIVGDLNARIGEYQNSSANILRARVALAESRCSEDKIFNRNGRNLTEFFLKFSVYLF